MREENMFSAIARTVIIYFIVIFSVRLMGKRQVGDLQPGELVITILISEIAAMPLQDPDAPVLTGIIAIFSLVVVEMFVSFLSMKFLGVRRVVNGSSAIIIKDGKLDQKLLKKLRVTAPDVLEVLRGQEVFDIESVQYAILETNGSLSVMLKPESRTATQENLNGDFDASEMPFLVISDGVVVKDGLKMIGKKQSDILSLLKPKKVEIKDVFIMTLDKEGNSNIILKDKNL